VVAVLACSCRSTETKREADFLEERRAVAQAELDTTTDEERKAEIVSELAIIDAKIVANQAKAEAEIAKGVEIGAAIGESVGGLLNLIGIPIAGTLITGLAASLRKS